MTGRLKLPFKLGDSKKTNESEVNETSKKEDFSLSEVNIILFFYLLKLRKHINLFILINRLYVTVFLIDHQRLHTILYKNFLL